MTRPAPRRESDVQSEIMRVYASHPRIRLFRRNVGLVTTPDGRRIRYGEPGQADLYGWILDPVLDVAHHIEIECKAKRGRLTEAQRNWRAMCRTTHVVHIVARSVDDVRDGFAEYGYDIPPTE